MPRPAIRALVIVAIAGSLVAITSGCHRPDPNTPEGRARIERDAERKRAKEEAKQRKRAARANATQPTPTTQAQPEPPVPPPSTPASATPAAAGGTCEASCEHYLRCKNLAGNAETQQKCVSACTTMKLTQQQLSGFEQTDCVNAIAIVENQNAGQSRPAQKSTTNACSGCVWDGSSCIWMSQSSWGAGPYSGAYSACDAACCRRR